MQSQQREGVIGALLCVAVAFGSYLLTLAPTVQGFDSAELTVGAYALGFVHPPGYPLYMLVGHLFSRLPFRDVGFRLNVMSAVFGALGTLVLYGLIYLQSGKWLSAVVGSLLFALSPIYWSQAIRAEVYTLHLFLVASSLCAWFCAFRFDKPGLVVLCYLLLGVGMANHLTTALLWASVLFASLWQGAKWRKLGLASSLLGLLIAAAVYLYFPWRSGTEIKIDYIYPYFGIALNRWSGLWWLISARAFHHSVYVGLGGVRLLQEILDFCVLVWDNTLGVGLLVGLLGWWRLQRTWPVWNLVLSVYALANAVLYLIYHVVDKEVMSIPLYAMVGIWAAHGIEGLVRQIAPHLQRWRSDRVNSLVHLALLLAIGIGAGLNGSSVTLSHNRRVYDFCVQLLEEVQPSTVIVNHWVTASVLDYLRLVEGKRVDVSSFHLDFYQLGLLSRYGSVDDRAAEQAWFAWVDEQIEQRPLCFVEPLPALPSHLRWTRQGACWEPVPGDPSR